MGLHRSHGELAEQVTKGREDEMKTIKRIFSVVLLLVLVLGVGYLFHTGSRLSAMQEEAIYEQTD